MSDDTHLIMDATAAEVIHGQTGSAGNPTETNIDNNADLRFQLTYRTG